MVLWLDRGAGRAVIELPNDKRAEITRREATTGPLDFVIEVCFETALPVDNRINTDASALSAPSLDEAISMVKTYMRQQGWISQAELAQDHQRLADG